MIIGINTITGTVGAIRIGGGIGNITTRMTTHMIITDQVATTTIIGIFTDRIK